MWLEITLEFEESFFEGTSAYVLGAVLEFIKPAMRWISWLLGFPMAWANWALASSPWVLIVGLTTAIGWWIGGWKMAALGFFGLIFVLMTGYCSRNCADLMDDCLLHLAELFGKFHSLILVCSSAAVVVVGLLVESAKNNRPIASINNRTLIDLDLRIPRSKCGLKERRDLNGRRKEMVRRHGRTWTMVAIPPKALIQLTIVWF